MPLFDYECLRCGHVFEVLEKPGNPPSRCAACGGEDLRKRVGLPAFRIADDSGQVRRIEKRVKDYLKDGKWGDATRFADKAVSMTRSDKVKRIADKLHQKTGRP